MKTAARALARATVHALVMMVSYLAVVVTVWSLTPLPSGPVATVASPPTVLESLGSECWQANGPDDVIPSRVILADAYGAQSLHDGPTVRHALEYVTGERDKLGATVVAFCM